MNGDVVTSAGVSQASADLAAVERTAAALPEIEELTERDPVREAFVLHTCHRVEVYVVTDTPAVGRDVLESVGGPATRIRNHEASLRHLLRVAAGLESMVLGEDQVLGQVRDAYEAARAAGTMGPVLEEAVTKAIRVGERARTETAINEGVVSLGSASVRLAARHTHVEGATAVVVGAGEMGSLAAAALAERADRIVVANRTVDRAAAVTSELEVPAESTDLDGIGSHIGDAAVVVTATGSPEPVITGEVLRDAGETVVIDLASPPDVAPVSVPGVRVFDYTDLEAVTERTHDRRREAAREVKHIVDEEYEHLLQEFKRKRADDVIAAMYESAERLKRRELETALTRLDATDDLTPEQREIVESLADSLVSQLLAAPTRSLREAAAKDDWTTISTALALFDPNFADPDADEHTIPPGALPDEAPSPADLVRMLGGSPEREPAGDPSTDS